MNILYRNVAVFLISSVLVSGCGKIETYGSADFGGNTVNIRGILAAPERHEGETVEVKGRIIRECPSGCWFDIKDNTGEIHVDINPSGFAIPQKTGSVITARGKVKMRNGNAMIIGEGVKIE